MTENNYSDFEIEISNKFQETMLKKKNKNKTLAFFYFSSLGVIFGFMFLIVLFSSQFNSWFLFAGLIFGIFYYGFLFHKFHSFLQNKKIQKFKN